MWKKMYSLMIVLTAMGGLAMLPACEEDAGVDVDTPGSPAVDRDVNTDTDLEINRVEPVTPQPQTQTDTGNRTNVIVEPNQPPIPPQPDDQQQQPQQPGATTPPSDSPATQPGQTQPQP